MTLTPRPAPQPARILLALNKADADHWRKHHPELADDDLAGWTPSMVVDQQHTNLPEAIELVLITDLAVMDEQHSEAARILERRAYTTRLAQGRPPGEARHWDIP